MMHPRAPSPVWNLKCFLMPRQIHQLHIIIAPKNPGNNQMRVDGVEAYQPWSIDMSHVIPSFIIYPARLMRHLATPTRAFTYRDMVISFLEAMWQHSNNRRPKTWKFQSCHMKSVRKLRIWSDFGVASRSCLSAARSKEWFDLFHHLLTTSLWTHIFQTLSW